MKNTMTILTAAILVAGNLNAQSSQEFRDMHDRLQAMRSKKNATPVEVAALIEDAKAMVQNARFTGGPSATVEQKAANDIIHLTTSLMGMKVSYATAREFSAAREYWEYAVLYGWQAPDPGVVVGYARNWVAAAPESILSKLTLLRARALINHEDTSAELDALLAANPGKLTSIEAYQAMMTWEANEKLEAAVTLAGAKDFFAKLSPAVAPAHVRNVTARMLAYRANLDENVNADIAALLANVTGVLRLDLAEMLYDAYKPVTAGNAQLSAFYDMLVRAVEAKPTSAAFLRKILDQKLKLQ